MVSKLCGNSRFSFDSFHNMAFDSRFSYLANNYCGNRFAFLDALNSCDCGLILFFLVLQFAHDIRVILIFLQLSCIVYSYTFLGTYIFDVLLFNHMIYLFAGSQSRSRSWKETGSCCTTIKPSQNLTFFFFFFFLTLF